MAGLAEHCDVLSVNHLETCGLNFLLAMNGLNVKGEKIYKWHSMISMVTPVAF